MFANIFGSGKNKNKAKENLNLKEDLKKYLINCKDFDVSYFTDNKIAFVVGQGKDLKVQINYKDDEFHFFEYWYKDYSVKYTHPPKGSQTDMVNIMLHVFKEMIPTLRNNFKAGSELISILEQQEARLRG